jgi:hypothetical protein
MDYKKELDRIKSLYESKSSLYVRKSIPKNLTQRKQEKHPSGKDRYAEYSFCRRSFDELLNNEFKHKSE